MRKILLVEDDPLLREVYEDILSTQPYGVEVVANGKEALGMIQQKDFDLILLDLMMPVMDGIEFLRQYSDLAKAKNKIIIMSNVSAGKEIDQARHLGVHKFILKADFSPKELIATIRYHFEA